uniref:Ionotropic glutamate receptor C-terminal domain-containing protein n=1 Tax=Leersia perrieri TaxID=77586 RepID=A0A0D9WMS6_9ORYZ
MALNIENKSLARRRAAVAAILLTVWSSAMSGTATITTAHEDETKRINAGVRRNIGGLPRGYEKELKIAVPWKPGFKSFLNVTDRSVSGYCIDVFEAAVKKLPYHLSYKFVIFNGSYDQLVQRVSSANYDAAVGDITITAERTSHADFTMPYTESGVSMLVLTEDDSKSTIQWIFLKPLTVQLWLATVIFFLFTGVVIWMIERPRNLEYQGSRSKQFSTALYFSFSTLTFSHGHIIKSPLSKIVESYTASLSSILTAKKLRPSETDLDQILFDGDSVGYQQGSFVESFLKKRGFSEIRLRSYRNKQEYAEALKKGSKNGGVSAIVDEIPYLTSFLSDPRYEKEFQMLSRIYKTPGFGFVFPPGFPLVHNLSTGILDVTGGDEGSRIEAKWFGMTPLSPSYPKSNTDSAPLTLRSFSGLFIITGCISILMLLIRISKLVLATCDKVTDSDVQSPDVDGGNGAQEESNQAQNVIVNGFVADMPLNEIRIDNFQDIHGMILPADETERMNAGVRKNLGGLPEGYQKKLRIVVPLKHGFKAFVNVSDHGVTGYSVDVFEAAVKKLPHQLIYKFVVFNGSYDQLVQSVSSGINDAAVGDITITADRASHVEFTMPYTESGVAMLVLAEDESESTIKWVFLKPLTKELWIATMIFFLFTAFVIWMIERPGNMEYQGSNTRQFSTALYFSFSTLTFSHGQIIKSPLSKIVVVIWCFVVLVLVQSYTASLSSILTVKRLQPSVTDLDQLLFNGHYVGYQEGSFVQSFLTKQGFSERRLRPYINKREYAEALRKGSKNGVSAIVDEIPYLTSFLSDPRYEKEFRMLSRIYKTPGFGFVFPPSFPLVHNLSTAILDVTSGDEGSRIEAKWFGAEAISPSYAIPNTDSAPLTLRSFSGLFIITGCMSALMLMISISKSVLVNYTEIRHSDVQSPYMDGEIGAREESNPTQYVMGEIRTDDSQDIHRSIESAGVEERGPIQNDSTSDCNAATPSPWP